MSGHAVEEYNVPSGSPPWEQAEQPRSNALPMREHRPLLHGVNDTSKGTVTEVAK